MHKTPTASPNVCLNHGVEHTAADGDVVPTSALYTGCTRTASVDLKEDDTRVATTATATACERSDLVSNFMPPPPLYASAISPCAQWPSPLQLESAHDDLLAQAPVTNRMPARS
ncbi:hypothetical protein PHYPSEUDO_003165 [Phytophthora pseudosyringae]|uniref:Uncharacterized protein n=1 Tax=Phytophthora pseudosyringae TaxID=221518 RepID=A0A8T1VSS8_9STRA|nr:hypothetical protein PHYPSEUDO_003165 [Phytophthora pseudosyringae]